MNEPCPTCSGSQRETKGLICQTCGRDYGRSDEMTSKAMTELVNALFPHAVVLQNNYGKWVIYTNVKEKL